MYCFKENVIKSNYSSVKSLYVLIKLNILGQNFYQIVQLIIMNMSVCILQSVTYSKYMVTH